MDMFLFYVCITSVLAVIGGISYDKGQIGITRLAIMSWSMFTMIMLVAATVRLFRLYS